MTAWMTYTSTCGTARTVLALLRARGIAVEVREYLKEPLTRGEIAALLAQMGARPADVVRWKQEADVAAHGITPQSDDATLLDVLAATPILLNRPIVRTAKGVKLCRPSEVVLELL